jgi:hypothetical protein
MDWGIGLGRDWLSGRYAVLVPFAFVCQRSRKASKKGREEGAQTRQKHRFESRKKTLERSLSLTKNPLCNSFSANRPRPQTPLDSIKFVCKDLWPLLFRKQIDNLKTNHRGVFVLTDQRFQPISRVSVDRKAGVKAPEETLSRAQAVSYS